MVLILAQQSWGLQIFFSGKLPAIVPLCQKQGEKYDMMQIKWLYESDTLGSILVFLFNDHSNSSYPDPVTSLGNFEVCSLL